KRLIHFLRPEVGLGLARSKADAAIEAHRPHVIGANFQGHFAAAEGTCLCFHSGEQLSPDALAAGGWAHGDVMNIDERLAAERRKSDEANRDTQRVLAVVSQKHPRAAMLD